MYENAPEAGRFGGKGGGSVSRATGALSGLGLLLLVGVAAGVCVLFFLLCWRGVLIVLGAQHVSRVPSDGPPWDSGG